MAVVDLGVFRPDPVTDIAVVDGGELEIHRELQFAIRPIPESDAIVP